MSEKWHVDFSDCLHPKVRDERGDPIVSFGNQARHQGLEKVGKRVHLIAAAPDLLVACELAKQHLDALRLEAGICNCLTESQRDVFKFVDETLQAQIRKARGEQAR